MSFLNVIALVGILAAFALFMATLSFAERQTRAPALAKAPPPKRH